MVGGTPGEDQGRPRHRRGDRQLTRPAPGGRLGSGQHGPRAERPPDNAGQSAAAISNRFEVPSLTAGGLASEAAKRAAIANSYGAVPSIPSLGASTPGRNTNVKIDNITIQTQASDSAGIAREVGVELKNQIRMAMSNFDDGVSA
nr:hypothetical protein [Fimbriiglobus ruber]